MDRKPGLCVAKSASKAAFQDGGASAGRRSWNSEESPYSSRREVIALVYPEQVAEIKGVALIFWEAFDTVKNRNRQRRKRQSS